MKWTKEQICDLLAHSDKAVKKGLLRIYTLQTMTEQDTETTHEHNGVGFTGFDGQFMTSLAKWLIRRGDLTPKQMKHARKKMMRYAGQLAKIANGEITCPPLPTVKGVTYAVKKATPPKTEDELEREAVQEEGCTLVTPLPPLEW